MRLGGGTGLQGDDDTSGAYDGVSYLSLVRTPNLRKHTVIICYQWYLKMGQLGALQ